MPNDYFQFKEFTIYQANTAMKVSTDACIQGAFFADLLQNFFSSKDISVLDIGTGTGLLSLMLAQKNKNASITAIEISDEAIKDVAINFLKSPWQARLELEKTSLQTFTFLEKFDAIICNPPFFKNHLKSNSELRKFARHDDSLGKNEIAEYSFDLLNDKGLICIMYPINEWPECLAIFQKSGFFLCKKLSVKSNTQKLVNRIIAVFTKEKVETIWEEELIIYEAQHIYSEKMKKLLKDFYLNF